jgi:hypothetical protein
MIGVLRYHASIARKAINFNRFGSRSPLLAAAMMRVASARWAVYEAWLDILGMLGAKPGHGGARAECRDPTQQRGTLHSPPT